MNGFKQALIEVQQTLDTLDDANKALYILKKLQEFRDDEAFYSILTLPSKDFVTMKKSFCNDTLANLAQVFRRKNQNKDHLEKKKNERRELPKSKKAKLNAEKTQKERIDALSRQVKEQNWIIDEQNALIERLEKDNAFLKKKLGSEPIAVSLDQFDDDLPFLPPLYDMLAWGTCFNFGEL